MEFRRAVKPQAHPLRYVEDSGAKYDFIRPSSLKGCLPVRRTQTGGSIGCMLHISDSGYVFSKLRSFTESVRKDSLNGLVQ